MFQNARLRVSQGVAAPSSLLGHARLSIGRLLVLRRRFSHMSRFQHWFAGPDLASLSIHTPRLWLPSAPAKPKPTSTVERDVIDRLEEMRQRITRQRRYIVGTHLVLVFMIMASLLTGLRIVIFPALEWQLPVLWAGVMTLCIGVLLLIRQLPALKDVAVLLDQRMGLRAQLETALEIVDGSIEHTRISEAQVARARDVIEGLTPRWVFPRPALSMEKRLLAVGAILLSILLLISLHLSPLESTSLAGARDAATHTATGQSAAPQIASLQRLRSTTQQGIQSLQTRQATPTTGQVGGSKGTQASGKKSQQSANQQSGIRTRNATSAATAGASLTLAARAGASANGKARSGTEGAPGGQATTPSKLTFSTKQTGAGAGLRPGQQNSDGQSGSAGTSNQTGGSAGQSATGATQAGQQGTQPNASDQNGPGSAQRISSQEQQALTRNASPYQPNSSGTSQQGKQGNSQDGASGSSPSASTNGAKGNGQNGQQAGGGNDKNGPLGQQGTGRSGAGKGGNSAKDGQSGGRSGSPSGRGAGRNSYNSQGGTGRQAADGGMQGDYAGGMRGGTRSGNGTLSPANAASSDSFSGMSQDGNQLAQSLVSHGGSNQTGQTGNQGLSLVIGGNGANGTLHDAGRVDVLRGAGNGWGMVTSAAPATASSPAYFPAPDVNDMSSNDGSTQDILRTYFTPQNPTGN